LLRVFAHPRRIVFTSLDLQQRPPTALLKHRAQNFVDGFLAESKFLQQRLLDDDLQEIGDSLLEKGIVEEDRRSFLLLNHFHGQSIRVLRHVFVLQVDDLDLLGSTDRVDDFLGLRFDDDLLEHFAVLGADVADETVHSEELLLAVAAVGGIFDLVDAPGIRKNFVDFRESLRRILDSRVNSNRRLCHELLVAEHARMLPFSDVRLDVSVQVLLAHELLAAHLAGWHGFLEENQSAGGGIPRNQTHVHVDKFDVLSQPRLPVELLAAKIADQRVLAVVVEHVRLQLRVLNEFFPTDLALVVTTSRVGSNVSVEGFLGSKAVTALWARIGTFARMNSSSVGTNLVSC
jgi:hypothetical protein